MVAVILLLFVGPVVVFAGKLIEARRWGIIAYGGLAKAVGANWKRNGSMSATASMSERWMYRIFPLPPISTKLSPTSIK